LKLPNKEYCSTKIFILLSNLQLNHDTKKAFPDGKQKQAESTNDFTLFQNLKILALKLSYDRVKRLANRLLF